MLEYSDTHSVLSALIESRAAGKFIDQGVIKQLQIPLMELIRLMELNTIDVGPIGTEIIMHCTPQLFLCASYLHHEQISFFITDSPKHPPILGNL